MKAKEEHNFEKGGIISCLKTVRSRMKTKMRRLILASGADDLRRADGVRLKSDGVLAHEQMNGSMKENKTDRKVREAVNSDQPPKGSSSKGKRWARRWFRKRESRGPGISGQE